MAHLFIIAGHGAGDPGATGNGYQEAERVRALAAKIGAYGGGDVTIADTSRNWYADNGISSLSISKGWQILELHMDSSSATSARGGHVIIKTGLAADAYDKALAVYISSVFPGRSQTLVGRNDLANPKRAAAKGYGYRLVECGFISNAQDVQIFNSRIDEIAEGILQCFGINTAAGNPEESEPENSGDKMSLKIDGSFGPSTVQRTQEFLGVSVDGVVSNQPTSNKKYLSAAYTGCWEFKSSGYNAGSNMIRALQKLIGAGQDGWFGRESVMKFQAFLGVAQDGSMGPDTVKAWQRYLNEH